MLSNRGTRFFVLYCLGFTFGIQYVYVNKNVTIEEAWTTCHNVYNGSLADIKNIKTSHRIEDEDANKISDNYWHGVFEKTTNWITFEGCYDENELDIKRNSSLTSIAQCQAVCGHELDTYFSVGDKICLCNDTTWNLTLAINQSVCDTDCGVSGLCEGNSTQVNIYRNVEVTLTKSDNDNELCLGFKCHQHDPMEFIALDCNAKIPYICGKSVNDEHYKWKVFANFINECWNIAENKDLMSSSICQSLNYNTNHIRWTPVFRKKWHYEDTEKATLDDLRNTVRITDSDKNRTKPFLCKTDTNESTPVPADIKTSMYTSQEATSFTTESESTLGVTWVSPSTDWSDPTRCESSSLTSVYGLLVGILVLLTFILLLYIKDHISRHRSEVFDVEMRNRTQQAGVKNVSAPLVADDNRTRRNSGHNNVSKDDIDVVYNEEVERGNLAASNYTEDRTYIEIISEQNESENGDSEQSYYSEVPERVYETLNVCGIENVYDQV